MPPEIAFATPRAEEMTKVVTAGAGAGITGAVEGVIVKMAPQLGALEPVFTWGTLLGIPTLAAAGALFTRGLLGDLFLGAACGGLGVVGYSLPEMLAPITGGGALAQRSLGAGPGIKLLPAAAYAPQRAQSAAALVAGNPGKYVGQLPANTGYIPIVSNETMLV